MELLKKVVTSKLTDLIPMNNDAGNFHRAPTKPGEWCDGFREITELKDPKKWTKDQTKVPLEAPLDGSQRFRAGERIAP